MNVGVHFPCFKISKYGNIKKKSSLCEKEDVQIGTHHLFRTLMRHASAMLANFFSAARQFV